jgi:hypothetical protein
MVAYQIAHGADVEVIVSLNERTASLTVRRSLDDIAIHLFCLRDGK